VVLTMASKGGVAAWFGRAMTMNIGGIWSLDDEAMWVTGAHWERTKRRTTIAQRSSRASPADRVTETARRRRGVSGGSGARWRGVLGAEEMSCGLEKLQ
jgi:hypothetical protein